MEYRFLIYQGSLAVLLFIWSIQAAFAFDVDAWYGGVAKSVKAKSVKSVSHKNKSDHLKISSAYQINSGDLLEISVWREPDFKKKVVVRPDGKISVPLLGEVKAEGKTITELQKYIAGKLEKYIPDPVVTVSTESIKGNKVFVLGNVNRPGGFVMDQRIDVMQALGIAGGTSTFADPNQIKILRRMTDGKQVIIPFKYDDVEQGKNLDQNITLISGDVVIVP